MFGSKGCENLKIKDGHCELDSRNDIRTKIAIIQQ